MRGKEREKRDVNGHDIRINITCLYLGETRTFFEGNAGMAVSDKDCAVHHTGFHLVLKCTQV